MVEPIRSSVPIPTILRETLDRYVKNLEDIVERYRGKHLHFCVAVVDEVRSRVVQEVYKASSYVYDMANKMVADKSVDLALNRLALDALKARRLPVHNPGEAMRSIEAAISRLEHEISAIIEATRSLLDDIFSILREYIEKVDALEKRCFEPKAE